MPLHVSATFVAILGEVHCKGNIKNPFEPMHKYKILSCRMYGLKYENTECPRRNGQNVGRVFLMLKYTDITQNTYIQSWTVTEIMAREV